MKKLLFFILFPLTVFASNVGMVGVGTGSYVEEEAGCTTENDTAGLVSKTTSSENSAIDTDDAWIAQGIKFTPATSITQIVLHCRDDADAGAVTATLYGDNSGVPGTAVAGYEVGSVSASTFSAETDITFTLTTPWELTADTQYHIVFKGSGGGSFSVYDGSSSGGSDIPNGGWQNTSNGGSSWVTTYVGTYDVRMSVNGCQ